MLEAAEHIGSTSVPGLGAKPFLDLRVRVTALPEAEALDAALAPNGFAPTSGSRPNPPGVTADTPRGSEQVPDAGCRTRLHVAEIDDVDPEPDDDTRAKTAYFDRVQAAFEAWARGRP